MADFINVNVKVGGRTERIQMEKGVVFENKGGKYTIDANGQLMKFDKNSNVWVNASQIDMTRYQWEAFQNVSDNDGQVGIYSKRDIQLAQAKYREGGFTADMKQNLPAGYRIESPRLNSAEGYVQVNVTNGKESQSATLRFQIAEMNELRQASQAYQVNQTQASSSSSRVNNTRESTVSRNDIRFLQNMDFVDENGRFNVSGKNSFAEIIYFDENPHYPNADVFSKLNGKPVTPDLIDELVNIMLDEAERALQSESYLMGNDGSMNFSAFAIIVNNFSEYLKPETIDNLLNSFSNIVNNSSHFETAFLVPASANDVEKMKDFYNKLSPEQQSKYYEILFSVENNTAGIITNQQVEGDEIAKYVFADKLTGSNYELLKNLVTEINGPNDIASTRSQCKALIDALLSQGKITPAQANELYAAGGIRK